MFNLLPLTALKQWNQTASDHEPEEILSCWIWYSVVIQAVGKWRQEDQEYKVILSYVVSLSPAWATGDLHLKEIQNKGMMENIFFPFKLFWLGILS